MAQITPSTKIIKNHFKSIQEFDNYISTTPLNSVFKEYKNLASMQPFIRGFHKTNSLEEARQLLKNGWSEMAQKLTQTLKLSPNQTGIKEVRRPQYGVAGFQASVPRYLQGIPTNMIDQKKVVQKQKVVTIVKNISYSAFTADSEIVKHSLRALQIVQKIEEMGYRVNLDILHAAVTSDSNEAIDTRLRIKSSDQKLNISKVSFPLVHPDMLRRLGFRFLEVCGEIRSRRWVGGYGKPVIDRDDIRKYYLNDGEYYLHNYTESVESEIEKMGLK